MSKSAKFAWLDAFTEHGPTGSGAATARHVALAGWRYADRAGDSIRPGVARLAADTQLSDRTVRRALDLLRESGWYVRTHQGTHKGDADHYRLGTPVTVTAVPEPNTGHSDRSQPATPVTVTAVHRSQSPQYTGHSVPDTGHSDRVTDQGTDQGTDHLTDQGEPDPWTAASAAAVSTGSHDLTGLRRRVAESEHRHEDDDTAPARPRQRSRYVQR